MRRTASLAVGLLAVLMLGGCAQQPGGMIHLHVAQGSVATDELKVKIIYPDGHATTLGSTPNYGEQDFGPIPAGKVSVEIVGLCTLTNPGFDKSGMTIHIAPKHCTIG